MLLRVNKWKQILPLLFLAWSTFGYAQTYGNEWINYSQTYYKFPIVQTGIYRIDYTTLNNAGVPLTSFQTENIQVFGRESEVPVYIVDGGDSSFDPGDYLIFYAERNDGWLDSSVYLNPTSIGNPAYSLYNDTIHYFFTWDTTSFNNLRYQVETDVNFAAYPSIANYIWFKSEKYYTEKYHEGVKLSKISSSFFQPGEGWGRTAYNGVPGGHTSNLTQITPYPYTGGPQAKFHGLVTSASSAGGTNTINHHMQWSIGSSQTTIFDTTYKGYNQVRCTKLFNPNLLSFGPTPIQFKIIDSLGVATDYQAAMYHSIRYPRQPNFGNLNSMKFEVENDPQGKVHLDISNVNYNIPIMLVHGDTPRMVPFAVNGSFYSALIPNSSTGDPQTVIYEDTTNIIDVSGVSAVNGNGSFVDYLAMPNIEDALLFVYPAKLDSATTNYDVYRSSTDGGSYNVVKAEVGDLFMQFGGGIEKHVNGIRRFARYIYNNTTSKPVGLYLIGKGVREASINDTGWDGCGSRKCADRYEMNLVPSFGLPSSDVCITSNLEGPYTWAPLMPTGRISVQSNTELQEYLEKVKLFEEAQDQNSVYNTPNKDWQKHILHFAGGLTSYESDMFQTFLEAYEYLLEGPQFGGYVNRVYKESSNPLDPTILEEVTQRIEDGVSLMTYFGHSTATGSGFEINLDEPENWNNYGKYPVIFANSCYNGNVFQGSISKSEEFVQTPDFGAIAYMSSAGVGLAQFLHGYSTEFFREVSVNNYGGTLGQHMKNSIEELEPGNLNELYKETTATQIVLNGDPMLRINWHTEPEIELLASNVSFSPSNIDLTVDSIEMQIVLTNLGRSIVDTFLLEVTRDFPDLAADSIYLFPIPNLNYKHTINFKMPLQANVSVGINTFTIRADLPSTILEQYDEINNNQIIKQLYVNIDGILPVIPYKFAVVPNDSVTVKGSTINPIAAYNTYRFEIDTTDAFNSPEHRYALVSGLGGVKEVNPSDWLSVSSGTNMPLVCTDSTVYFWRCAVDSSVWDWKESSFQYITGKTGWGQDHFFQFKNNSFTGVIYNKPDRLREFGPYTREVCCDVRYGTSGLEPYYNAWCIDGEQQDYGVCNFTPKLHVAVIDPVTLNPWETYSASCGGTNTDPFYQFGNNNDDCACAPRSMKFFTFHQNDLARLNNFQNMIATVPDSFYILIYSPITTRYDWWNSIDSTDMYNLFTALGSDSINGNRPNTPFAFFCKKGDTNSVVEMFAPTATDNVYLTASIVGSDYEGVEAAPLIGPAATWGNVYWKQDPLEPSSTDSTVLRIHAYNLAQSLQTTIDTMFTSNDSILDLNNILDASQYPFISLEAYYNDSVTNTPAQVDRWHVLFQPIPEAAIDGTTAYLWSAAQDTLEEGQEIQFAVDVKNIFVVDMDSLLIDYWVEDANQGKITIPYPRQDSLKVGDILRDTITIPTAGLSGINSFWMEVNPYINGTYYETDQPEQAHFNNVLQVPFYVNPDEINPILDVTFDGRRILNGDIVNPYAEVLITLKDENEFMIMDEAADTALFGVYLTDPTGTQVKIPFMNAQQDIVMQWIPADPSNKRFKIIWPAEFTMDGEYTLFVQGADKSGNLSGDIEYRVSFEVIHESTITNMMNYPNPFSTSTRFVFTLTGSEVPDDILIQILTISGRVVKEITEDELGQIYIGRNITEYAWDGTDNFGDPLANGVYLYRVKHRLNGEEIKHRESGADEYFTKDFGKMYLMR